MCVCFPPQWQQLVVRIAKWMMGGRTNPLLERPCTVPLSTPFSHPASFSSCFASSPDVRPSYPLVAPHPVPYAPAVPSPPHPGRGVDPPEAPRRQQRLPPVRLPRRERDSPVPFLPVHGRRQQHRRRRRHGRREQHHVRLFAARRPRAGGAHRPPDGVDPGWLPKVRLFFSLSLVRHFVPASFCFCVVHRSRAVLCRAIAVSFTATSRCWEDVVSSISWAKSSRYRQV